MKVPGQPKAKAKAARSKRVKTETPAVVEPAEECAEEGEGEETPAPPAPKRRRRSK